MRYLAAGGNCRAVGQVEDSPWRETHRAQGYVAFSARWTHVGGAAGDYGNVSFITYASQRFRKASMSFSPRTFWRVLYPVGSSFRAATKSR